MSEFFQFPGILADSLFDGKPYDWDGTLSPAETAWLVGVPDASRLDAVQGSSEARTEPHKEVLLGSTGTDDTVMRQESWQATELSSEAGQDGGGDW